MKYTVRALKKHDVELPRKADFFGETDVQVNGEKWVVRILERSSNGNPRLVSINGRILPVQIERRTDGFPNKVIVNGLSYPVELEKIESTRFRAPAAQRQVNNLIRAELPGTVSTVMIEAGQHVKKGHVLLILEAMKMENEIVAPRDGIIKSISIHSGQSVLRGDLLIELN